MMEPSTFLDYRHQAKVATILKSACRENAITVIAVHHDINTAAASSDRILALKDGMLTEKQWKKPLLFMPLRFALTSRSDTPDLIEVMMVLGRDSVIDRIERAIAILECSA
jgi:ABC-type glutathione transport system ATPase component